MSPLPVGRRREKIKDGPLPSPKEERGNGDGARFLWVTLWDPNNPPSERGVTNGIGEARRGLPHGSDKQNVDFFNDPRGKSDQSARLFFAPSIETCCSMSEQKRFQEAVQRKRGPHLYRRGAKDGIGRKVPPSLGAVATGWSPAPHNFPIDLHFGCGESWGRDPWLDVAR